MMSGNDIGDKGGQVVVIGGGAAGMMAAYRAASRGLRVVVLEGTPRVLNKLRIAGKGRCNLTNAAQREEFLSNYARGSRFLMSAFSLFDNIALMAQFEAFGVPLKVERGQRVFPQDDRAHTVADALSYAVRKAGAVIKTGTRVAALIFENGLVRAVRTVGGDTVRCGACILATGGLSYPVTGSTGDGYRLAAAAGHTHTPLSPSLAPVQVTESFVAQLQGLSLKNVALKVIENGKTVFDKQGEMLFTHDGVSGPLVLAASAHMLSPKECKLVINLKPALSEQQLEARLLRELGENANKALRNLMPLFFPSSLCPVMLTLLGVDPLMPCHQLTRQKRRDLIDLMHNFTLTAVSSGPIEAAVVTRGGIALEEVNPKTMQSKLIPNLYFAGEVLDIDGYTGGFNLQAAFSTGYAAGHFCEIIQ